MKVDLRLLPIHALVGEEEGMDSLTLAQVFSSGGSRNVWMDSFGKVTVINGYSRITQTPVVSETGGNPTTVTSLHHYVNQSDAGGIIRQLLAHFDDGATHNDLRYSSDGGATWIFILDQCGSGNNSCGSIADYAALGDQLVIVNGINNPTVWDGSTITTIYLTQAGKPALAAGAAGALMGTYRVRIVPMLGTGIRKRSSAMSDPVVLINQQGDVTWAADPDPQVVSYEVYSTTGTGRVFYFAGIASGLAFTLDKDDLDLIQNRAMEEHGDAPPESRYVEAHKGRMMYGGVFSEGGKHAAADVHPRRWWWSDPGLPDSVYQENSYVDATDEESFSDATVGGTGNFRDSFVIWLERSVWVLSGSGQTIGPQVDLRLTRSNAKIGTVTHRAVVRVPAGAKYTDERAREQSTGAVTLAFFTPLGDIRLFDGDNDIIISTPKKKALSKLTYAARRLAFALDDIERGEITWVFPANGSLTASAAVTWNYRYGLWYDRPLWGGPFGCGVIDESESDAAMLKAGSNSLAVGGRVFLLWDGCTADGEPYPTPPQWMSKTLYFPGMAGPTEAGADGTELLTHQKRVRWVDLLFEVSGTVQLKVEWLKAEADDDATAEGFVLVTPGTSLLVDSDGNPIVDSGGNPITVNVLPALVRARFEDGDGRYYHGRGFRVRISAIP